MVTTKTDLEATHLQVGVITRPHGIRGELKLHLHNEDSEALRCVSQVLVEPSHRHGETKVFAIESVRGGSKGPILALATVDTCDQAEKLRGAKLWISRNELEPLVSGEYYLVDLVGCDVVLDGQVIAQVKDVRPDPSVDTMILAMKDGTRAEVPIVDAWVGQVDIVARTVQLLNEDGIIN